MVYCHTFVLFLHYNWRIMAYHTVHQSIIKFIRQPYSLFIFLVVVAFGCIQNNATQHTPLQYLGKKLFFDTRLSATGSKACASCHDPRFAFSDGYRTSPGLFGDTVRRNAPSLINTTFYTSLDWANPEVRTFEAQMLRPLFGTTPPELGLSATDQHTPYAKPIREVLDELMKDEDYRSAFRQAFPKHRNGWQLEHVTQAIAAFEQTLVSMNSPYDVYLKGDKTALSAAAQRGLALFFNPKSGCAACHSGKLFTNQAFYYAGFADSNDKGLFEITQAPADTFKFRTPTLRNLLFTAPYFHDGRAASLENVFRTPGHGQHLNKQECLDLIFFLESLTDSTVLKNPWFFE